VALPDKTDSIAPDGGAAFLPCLKAGVSRRGLINVRQVSAANSIMDIQGEVTAFAEDTLMEA